MKYTSPKYNNELLEAKDVITASALIGVEVNPENPKDASYNTVAEEVLGNVNAGM